MNAENSTQRAGHKGDSGGKAEDAKALFVSYTLTIAIPTRAIENP